MRDGLLSADAYLPPLTTGGAYTAPWPLRWLKIAEMDPASAVSWVIKHPDTALTA